MGGRIRAASLQPGHCQEGRCNQSVPFTHHTYRPEHTIRAEAIEHGSPGLGKGGRVAGGCGPCPGFGDPMRVTFARLAGSPGSSTVGFTKVGFEIYKCRL
jgi:hypothetical protein